jgi:hypothetical protein
MGEAAKVVDMSVRDDDAVDILSPERFTEIDTHRIQARQDMLRRIAVTAPCIDQRRFACTQNQVNVPDEIRKDLTRDTVDPHARARLESLNRR